MRIICKSNMDSIRGDILSITINKSYQLIQEDNFGYQVTDDEGRNFWYSKEVFYTPEETRDINLNSLIE